MTGNGSAAETEHESLGSILMPFSGRLLSLALLVAGGLTLLTGACSSPWSAASEEHNHPHLNEATPTSEAHNAGPESGSATGPTSSSDPAQPVGLSMRLSEGDALFLLRAQETLVSRCMAERGFLYREPDIPDDALQAPPLRWTPVYPEDATTVGYGIDPTLTGDREFDIPLGEGGGVDPNGAHLDTLAPEEAQAWIEALNGTENNKVVVEGVGETAGEQVFMFTDGCVAQVERQLYGDLGDVLRVDLVISQLSRERYEWIEVDPRVDAAKTAWLRCMNGEGFDVSDLADGYYLAEEAHASLPRDQALRMEIEIATTDAQCVVESRVNEVVEAVYEEAEKLLAEEHGAALAGIQELQEKAVERAKELLRSG